VKPIHSREESGKRGKRVKMSWSERTIRGLIPEAVGTNMDRKEISTFNQKK